MTGLRLPALVTADLDALGDLVTHPPGGPPQACGVPVTAAGRDRLGSALYRHWYLRWAAPPEGPVPTAVDFDPPRALRASHPASQVLEGGWEVQRASTSGRAVAARDGRIRLLHRGDYVVPARPGDRARPGDEVAATALVEDPDTGAGFWVTYHPGWQGEAALVRVYWRVTPGAAPHLVGLLARLLEEVPHALKVAATWDGFARGDAAVLYARRDHWDAVAPAVDSAAAALGDDLAGSPPRLVRALAPGVGMADGPAGGVSFGEHRCGLVADGLLRWVEGGGALAPAVAAAFAAAGLDLARPHLAAGHDEVAWPPPAPPSVPAPASPAGGGHRPPPPAAAGRVAAAGGPALVDPAEAWRPDPAPELLEGAARLGDRLCRQALWYEDRCLWLGAASDRVGGRWQVVHRSTAGDLYEGTAGIGLFLARLAASTRDREHARSAAGALAHASAWAAGGPVPTGLHTGLAGVAWAAAEVAAMTGDERIAAAARDLRGDLHAAAPAAGTAASDLMDGAAGLILALLALGEPPGSQPVAGLVAALRSTALDQPVGVAWDALMGDGSPPLCGLGHGAAGVALALLEVAGARPGGAADLGRGAMDYERSWFDRSASNWPDLREFDRTARRQGTRPATPVYWCHGAVGIGLQRLRAFELTGDPQALAELGAALQATEAQATALLGAGAGTDRWAANVSMCHGASGVADLLAAAGTSLRERRLLALGRDVGRWMLDIHGDGRVPWSCGIAGGGESPGLMLGLAGVGATLLHLADPQGQPPVGLLPLPSDRRAAACGR